MTVLTGFTVIIVLRVFLVWTACKFCVVIRSTAYIGVLTRPMTKFSHTDKTTKLVFSRLVGPLFMRLSFSLTCGKNSLQHKVWFHSYIHPKHPIHYLLPPVPVSVLLSNGFAVYISISATRVALILYHTVFPITSQLVIFCLLIVFVHLIELFQYA